MKEFGRMLIIAGCVLIVFVGDLIIGSYFGGIGCLTSLEVECIICGLLLIKFGDKNRK